MRPFALPALALGTAHVRYAPAVGRVVVRGRGRQLQVEGASLLATRVCTLAGWAGWPRTLQPHVHVRCAPPEPLGAPCEPSELIPRHSVRDEESAQITNLHIRIGPRKIFRQSHVAKGRMGAQPVAEVDVLGHAL